MLKDSGERRQFETGAVRDICEGKGRCDLLPLDILLNVQSDTVLACINQKDYICALKVFCSNEYEGHICTMWLDLAKHYEAGALKYGEYNWQKGIPCHCYLDSAIRHYLKFKRGDDDEPHGIAFVWNIVGLLWTMENKPELNDLGE